KKLSDSGFEFDYPHLAPALGALINEK
ncbi:MAG: DUF1731 domain-containing protein, partial [Actinobacteria bacterium]|nr:DUF1731 domain-containing protein [Actinomycetota bacterium]